MPLSFAEADRLYRANQLNDLTAVAAGRRFLKLRSLNRKEYLQRLFERSGVAKPEVRARALFEAAFDSRVTTQMIEACIREIYREERIERRRLEPDLVNQLYRVQEFNWGGLRQNNLEQTIVDNYVKRIRDYDRLCQSIDNELLVSMRGYVICSWYNHWTSIIIEDVFKEHPDVLPAVGLVKKIDFFIRNVPFDLKVTYLPEGYLAKERKGAGERPELTLLKQVARRRGLPIPTDLADADLLPDLWAKVEDDPSEDARTVIGQLRAFRNSVVDGIAEDPTDLIRWLYENQGDRRFDAANRLFLVLVDQRNYFDSWKLKRAKPLITEEIREYLDNCGQRPGRNITFTWEGTEYRVVSDVLMVRQIAARR
ncbi:MAG: hypothetical protein HYU30_08965 [Chloroflexi bacterium]|nr:hypothetical protein [Chloroflexota bacterium]